MTEMIERVAQALIREAAMQDAPVSIGYAEARALATAVMAAMREPTDAMVKASPEEGVGWNEYSYGYVQGFWRDMIDAALGREPDHGSK